MAQSFPCQHPLTLLTLDEFIFPMTIHPDVSGRPHVLLMHERIIEHINKHEGVRWVTMAEVSDICPLIGYARDTDCWVKMSDHFKSKNTPAPNALMPADAQEVMRKYHEFKNKQA